MIIMRIAEYKKLRSYRVTTPQSPPTIHTIATPYKQMHPWASKQLKYDGRKVILLLSLFYSLLEFNIVYLNFCY